MGLRKKERGDEADRQSDEDGEERGTVRNGGSLHSGRKGQRQGRREEERRGRIVMNGLVFITVFGDRCKINELVDHAPRTIHSMA